MKAILTKISNIKSNPSNPRIIKDDKFKLLVKSIKGFPKMLNLRPIVVDKDYMVLGGNMRLKACIEAGIKEVPVIVADNLSEKEQREFIVKDNVAFGEWDYDILANEWDVEELQDWGLNINIPTEIDLDRFFEDGEPNKEMNGKLVLQYSLEEYEKVKVELLKHGKSYEDAVYNLLGL